MKTSIALPRAAFGRAIAQTVKTTLCTAAFTVLCSSCGRQEKTPPVPALENQPKTNAVSKFDEHGRPTETVTYSPDGSVKHRIVFQTAEDGKVISSRTVDREGHLKWIEQHFFDEETSGKPLETRRTTPDGATIIIRYISDQDGNQKRIILGPDGTVVPPERQKDLLDE